MSIGAIFIWSPSNNLSKMLIKTLIFISILMISFSLSATERPNIIFIMSDDHATQAVSAYGSKLNKTPNIDRIANEGMRFDRAYVANAICGPSRATMLTGVHSHVNGFYSNDWSGQFDGSQPTLPKLLRDAGYQTAIFGKWHLGSEPTGFDDWAVISDAGGQGRYYNTEFLTSKGEETSEGYSATVITDKTLNWLAQDRRDDKPFLLIYQHKAPHRDWLPGPQELASFDDHKQFAEPATLLDDYANRAPVRATTRMTIAEHMNKNDVKLRMRGGLTETQQKSWHTAFDAGNAAFNANPPTGDALTRWKYQRYINTYIGSVTSMDREIGRVLDYLDENGLSENTIVVYTSDQGFFLGENGWFDKRWFDEESARTPLLVKWPKQVDAGSSNAQLVQNIDFAPTLLAAAGVPVPEHMQGKNFVPLLRGEQIPWRDAIYYHFYESPGFHNAPRHYGVRTDRYKLIHYYRVNQWELFDLDNDPDELISQYENSEYADVLAELKLRLTELQAEYEVPAIDPEPGYLRSILVPLFEKGLNWYMNF